MPEILLRVAPIIRRSQQWQPGTESVPFRALFINDGRLLLLLSLSSFFSKPGRFALPGQGSVCAGSDPRFVQEERGTHAAQMLSGKRSGPLSPLGRGR